MRALLADYLRELCKAAVQGARAATEESVEFVKTVSDELTIEPEVGGKKTRIEGAALQPQRMVIAEKFTMRTSCFLEQDAQGRVCVLLKKNLLRDTPELELEIDFRRSRPIEALEMLRDRANEVTRDNLAVHRADDVPAASAEEASSAAAATAQDLRTLLEELVEMLGGVPPPTPDPEPGEEPKPTTDEESQDG